METTLTPHEIRRTNFLTRLTLILFGTFLTSVIFALSVRLLEIAGIWVGLLICTAIIATIIRYKKPGSYLRIIAWSMLGTIIIGSIIYFAGLSYVKSTLEEFQTN